MSALGEDPFCRTVISLALTVCSVSIASLQDRHFISIRSAGRLEADQAGRNGTE